MKHGLRMLETEYKQLMDTLAGRDVMTAALNEEPIPTASTAGERAKMIRRAQELEKILDIDNTANHTDMTPMWDVVEALDAELRTWLDELLAVAPIPLVTMKRTLNETARQQYDEAAAQQAHVASLRTRDLHEALTAFAENRAPRFEGH